LINIGCATCHRVALRESTPHLWVPELFYKSGAQPILSTTNASWDWGAFRPKGQKIEMKTPY
jgi:hypothetical protein